MDQHFDLLLIAHVDIQLDIFKHTDTQELLQQARNVVCCENSSLLLPDLTLIILHIALRNLRVLGSIGPRTSIHIGKYSIEGRAFPYFFIFSSAALAAAKPHFLLVRFTYCSARGGAQGSVKFAQFRRINVFGCTQKVHQFGQTEGIADNSQVIMGQKTGNTTQGEFELRELLVKELYLRSSMNFENRWVLRSALNFASDGEVVREVGREFQRKEPEKAKADLAKKCLTRVKKTGEEEDGDDGEVVREVGREFQRKKPEKAKADLAKKCLTRVKKTGEEEDDRKPGRLGSINISDKYLGNNLD
ncbi:hypothetical protein HELRODRAFT_158566 [Helobdella robusta]|uniref:Uncharacterized protein n=1 Tax=Helobdella robusta TaxID=6412 RepID=T1EMY3_HELRO|nr:hypothetical protein HELRODRAFT_158566 [Helobdella robusta]ESO12126.1 hypothetical protein HELRODRAFT_158566 [Helobdella robusta]